MQIKEGDWLVITGSKCPCEGCSAWNGGFVLVGKKNDTVYNSIWYKSDGYTVHGRVFAATGMNSKTFREAERSEVLAAKLLGIIS